jgi:hypothetical protein
LAGGLIYSFRFFRSFNAGFVIVEEDSVAHRQEPKACESFVMDGQLVKGQMNKRFSIVGIVGFIDDTDIPAGVSLGNRFASFQINVERAWPIRPAHLGGVCECAILRTCTKLTKDFLLCPVDLFGDLKVGGE